MANFIDRSDEAKKRLEEAVEAALEAIGNQAVSHAKNVITRESRVDTGDLRNSVSHAVQPEEQAVYIGTNKEYAIYHEFGTGVHAEGGNGRKGWWVYVPGSTVKGKNTGKTYTYEEAKRIVAMMQADGIDAHLTQGIRPIHFLKSAVQDHQKEYQQIAASILREKMQ